MMSLKMVSPIVFILVSMVVVDSNGQLTDIATASGSSIPSVTPSGIAKTTETNVKPTTSIISDTTILKSLYNTLKTGNTDTSTHAPSSVTTDPAGLPADNVQIESSTQSTSQPTKHVTMVETSTVNSPGLSVTVSTQSVSTNEPPSMHTTNKVPMVETTSELSQDSSMSTSTHSVSTSSPSSMQPTSKFPKVEATTESSQEPSIETSTQSISTNSPSSVLSTSQVSIVDTTTELPQEPPMATSTHGGSTSSPSSVQSTSQVPIVETTTEQSQEPPIATPTQGDSTNEASSIQPTNEPTAVETTTDSHLIPTSISLPRESTEFESDSTMNDPRQPNIFTSSRSQESQTTEATVSPPSSAPINPSSVTTEVTSITDLINVTVASPPISTDGNFSEGNVGHLTQKEKTSLTSRIEDLEDDVDMFTVIVIVLAVLLALCLLILIVCACKRSRSKKQPKSENKGMDFDLTRRSNADRIQCHPPTMIDPLTGSVSARSTNVYENPAMSSFGNGQQQPTHVRDSSPVSSRYISADSQTLGSIPYDDIESQYAESTFANTNGVGHQNMGYVDDSGKVDRFIDDDIVISERL